MNWSKQKYMRQIFQSSSTSSRGTCGKLQSVYEILDTMSPVPKCGMKSLVARKSRLFKCLLGQKYTSTRKENIRIDLKTFLTQNGEKYSTCVISSGLKKYNNLSNDLHTSTVVERKGPPWRVLFLGTDQFSSQVLQILHESRSSRHTGLIDKLDVVSNIGETRVRQYAVSAGLTVHDWPIPVETGRYDVGVLASFGQLIPANVINMFPWGILNVHPSLLPKWRGASPIIHTILSRDHKTGVSIMKLRPKHFDIGTVLAQKEVALSDDTTSFQLRDLLAQQGGQLLLEVLQALSNVKEREQSEHGVTYAHKVNPTMAFIDWKRQSCEDIHCQYRALGELLPLRSEMDGSRIKLLDMQKVQRDSNEVVSPGTVVFDKKRKLICIRCRDGWVGFENIVIRKKMSAQAFYNGYLSKMAADRKLCLTSVSNGLDIESYGKRILQRR